MLNKNSNFIFRSSLILGILFFISCTDRLDVLDENNPTIETYFKDASELEKGVNAIYSTLRSGEVVGREWFYVHDMRGIECAPGGSQLEAPRAELLNEPKPSSANTVMTTLWTGLYHMVNRANIVLSKASEVDDDTELRDRLVGEAKFLRAWAYFELVAQWGDVPVYTEPVSSSTEYQGLTSTSEIYDIIITDLKDASKSLPESYSSSDLGRATNGAAYALLGKVLMQKGDYEEARDALLEIYGRYTLVDNYMWNFDGDVYDDKGNLVTEGHEFNSESIFEVVFVDKGTNEFNWGNTGEGVSEPMSTIRNQEYGIAWGNIIPSDYALEQFPDNDPRYKYTFFEEGDEILSASSEGPKVLESSDMNIGASTRNGEAKKRFFRKYNIYDWVESGDHPGGINQRLIRYADVLLLLAECEAEIGAPEKAAGYINEVRSRPSVNMPSVNPSNKEEAMEAVIHERAVELCAEEVNNLDLKRWREQGHSSLIQDPKPDQSSTLPIPATEISENPEID